MNKTSECAFVREPDTSESVKRTRDRFKDTERDREVPHHRFTPFSTGRCSNTTPAMLPRMLKRGGGG